MLGTGPRVARRAGESRGEPPRPTAAAPQVGVPAAATQAAVPADNPQTPEKIALGQRLFFERRLSADGSVSCSTCTIRARIHRRKPTSSGIDAASASAMRQPS